LAQYGADVNILNKVYFSPLYLAILNEHEELANYLVQAGAAPY
jgi:ankyrin repeat protein